MIGRLETYGQWLAQDPAGFAVFMVYLAATVLLSLILHECAHGWAALISGDPTAKMLGRLTLNPLKHLDPVGTACMFLLGFGWAKPVPVNPRNFRNPRRDDFLVSVAGITVNLTLFVICAALSVLGIRIMMGGELYAMNAGNLARKQELYEVMRDLLAYGGAALPAELTAYMAVPWLQYVLRFLVMMQQINLTLAIFNLLPIPPLDGFRLLNNALQGRLRMSRQTYQIIRMAMLVLFLSGWLGRGLSVATDALDSAVTRVFLLI